VLEIDLTGMAALYMTYSSRSVRSPGAGDVVLQAAVAFLDLLALGPKRFVLALAN
jgi:hypothetical protein